MNKWTWLTRHTPLRWYLPNELTRMELVQRAIDGLGARAYLEIGVDQGECFSRVRAATKVGVDPVPAQPLVVREIAQSGASYFAMTSDAFFADAAPQVLTRGVDVALIDGLHTYAQAYRDITNVLGYLNPGGLILVHDCLPATAAQAWPAESHEQAWAHNGPDWDGYWTGDTWKAIVAVRSLHADCDACVLHCDFGVGLIHRAPNQSGLRHTAELIAGLTYADLTADPQSLIGLCAPARFRTVIRNLASTRRDG